MIAYLTGETGDAVATQILVDNPGDCFAHVFNLMKVYYVFFRRGGQAAAEEAVQTLLDAGVIACEDADTAFLEGCGDVQGPARSVSARRVLSGSASEWESGHNRSWGV